MITYLGSVSLGDLQPALASASASIDTNATVALDAATAKLDGLIAAKAEVTANPPNLAGSLATLQQMLAGVQAAISLGVPEIDAGQMLADLDVSIGEVMADIGDLQAALNASADISLALGAAGFAAWVYDGTAGNFASELGSETDGGILGGGSGQQINAIVIATPTPASWAALQEIFGL